MEKVCDFCNSSRPVIYCNSDAAQLCLPCDHKIHSANALSGRHLRTLLCAVCLSGPCYVRCLEHKSCVCQNCDNKLHHVASEHHRCTIDSYMGCPSAREFTIMWALEYTEADHDLSTDFLVLGVAQSDILGQFCSQSSTYRQNKKYLETRYQQDRFIMQQIRELKTIRLDEVNQDPIETPDVFSSACKNLSENEEQSETESQQNLQYPFIEPDHLSTQCSQLWSQNIQDLGVCEDIVCNDSSSIPDIDLTFQNFEELFGAKQDFFDDSNSSKHKNTFLMSNGFDGFDFDKKILPITKVSSKTKAVDFAAGKPSKRHKWKKKC